MVVRLRNYQEEIVQQVSDIITFLEKNIRVREKIAKRILESIRVSPDTGNLDADPNIVIPFIFENINSHADIVQSLKPYANFPEILWELMFGKYSNTQYAKNLLSVYGVNPSLSEPLKKTFFRPLLFIELPTGSGKTIIFTEIMKNYFQKPFQIPEYWVNEKTTQDTLKELKKVFYLQQKSNYVMNHKYLLLILLLANASLNTALSSMIRENKDKHKHKNILNDPAFKKIVFEETVLLLLVNQLLYQEQHHSKDPLWAEVTARITPVLEKEELRPSIETIISVLFMHVKKKRVFTKQYWEQHYSHKKTMEKTLEENEKNKATRLGKTWSENIQALMEYADNSITIAEIENKKKQHLKETRTFNNKEHKNYETFRREALKLSEKTVALVKEVEEAQKTRLPIIDFKKVKTSGAKTVPIGNIEKTTEALKRIFSSKTTHQNNTSNKNTETPKTTLNASNIKPVPEYVLLSIQYNNLIELLKIIGGIEYEAKTYPPKEEQNKNNYLGNRKPSIEELVTMLIQEIELSPKNKKNKEHSPKNNDKILTKIVNSLFLMNHNTQSTTFFMYKKQAKTLKTEATALNLLSKTIAPVKKKVMVLSGAKNPVELGRQIQQTINTMLPEAKTEIIHGTGSKTRIKKYFENDVLVVSQHSLKNDVEKYPLIMNLFAKQIGLIIMDEADTFIMKEDRLTKGVIKMFSMLRNHKNNVIIAVSATINKKKQQFIEKIHNDYYEDVYTQEHKIEALKFLKNMRVKPVVIRKDNYGVILNNYILNKLINKKKTLIPRLSEATQMTYQEVNELLRKNVAKLVSIIAKTKNHEHKTVTYELYNYMSLMSLINIVTNMHRTYLAETLEKKTLYDPKTIMKLLTYQQRTHTNNNQNTSKKTQVPTTITHKGKQLYLFYAPSAYLVDLLTEKTRQQDINEILSTIGTPEPNNNETGYGRDQKDQNLVRELQELLQTNLYKVTLLTTNKDGETKTITLYYTTNEKYSHHANVTEEHNATPETLPLKQSLYYDILEIEKTDPKQFIRHVVYKNNQIIGTHGGKWVSNMTDKLSAKYLEIIELLRKRKKELNTEEDLFYYRETAEEEQKAIQEFLETYEELSNREHLQPVKTSEEENKNETQKQPARQNTGVKTKARKRKIAKEKTLTTILSDILDQAFPFLTAEEKQTITSKTIKHEARPRGLIEELALTIITETIETVFETKQATQPTQSMPRKTETSTELAGMILKGAMKKNKDPSANNNLKINATTTLVKQILTTKCSWCNEETVHTVNGTTTEKLENIYEEDKETYERIRKNLSPEQIAKNEPVTLYVYKCTKCGKTLKTTKNNQILLNITHQQPIPVITNMIQKIGASVEEIHGSIPHDARKQLLKEFHENNSYDVLVTNVSGRGIDLPKINHNIIIDVPNDFVELMQIMYRTRGGNVYLVVHPTRKDLKSITDKIATIKNDPILSRMFVPEKPIII